MCRSKLWPLPLLALLGCGLSTFGAESEPSAPPIFSASNPAPAKSPAPPTAPLKSQVTSPLLAAALASDIPRYAPPQPGPRPRGPAALATSPKNQIPRLPPKLLSPFIVRASHYRKLADKEVYTDRVFTDMQVKHYLTEFDSGFLNRYTIPLFGSASKETRAMEQFDKDQMKEAAGEEHSFSKLEKSDDRAP